MRQAGQMLTVNPLVVGHVDTHDMHQVVGVAGHQMAAHHLGRVADGGLELVEDFLGL